MMQMYKINCNLVELNIHLGAIQIATEVTFCGITPPLAPNRLLPAGIIHYSKVPKPARVYHYLLLFHLQVVQQNYFLKPKAYHPISAQQYENFLLQWL